MEVGVRDLRDHLSRYLDRVRDGDEVIQRTGGERSPASYRLAASASLTDSSPRAA